MFLDYIELIINFSTIKMLQYYYYYKTWSGGIGIQIKLLDYTLLFFENPWFIWAFQLHKAKCFNELSNTILGYIVFINITIILVISFMNKNNRKAIYFLSIIVSILYLLRPLLEIVKYYYLPEISNIFQLKMVLTTLSPYGVTFSVGIDGLSICFLILTILMMTLCIHISYTIKINFKMFILYIWIIELCLILSFIALDLILFYIFFEMVLIPMFLLIGQWGSRERKIKAAYYLVLYTLFGSFFLLVGILWLYILTGTTNIEILTNFDVFYSIQNISQAKILWLCFFLPFAIKIPMFPFHIWLTEAHVEAPTIGSIILASLVLKLGGYGFLRLIFNITGPYLGANCIAHALAIASIIFGSLSAIRQIDLKRIIAYSSIAHMNLIVLGIFSLTKQGWDGAIYLMIGHSFVSAALFFCIGIMYDRYHTRLLQYYGDLAQTMPIFAIFFFVFTIANIGFPGTSNFIGESLIFLGIIQTQIVSEAFSMLVLVGFTIILSSIYSIWLFNRIFFGTWKTQYVMPYYYRDLTARELTFLIIMFLMILLLGINSQSILRYTPSEYVLISV